ncbi:hypothetical protein [Paracoccus methylarcula]|uniref:Phage tail tape measure protein n=1 Tax=Paracoccus methylarcula TaxID=72022 RepID=A0A3R7SBS0_9RHOB|nr:hypothetical protein [Paracoccus methylarcula]RNF32954.1 hypothetical protein A7A09_019265 [Paracoccus methylarcula]
MFSSGVQGLIGNLFPAGSAGGGLIGGIFGGFRAKGGPVSSGRSYIVGEEGPELFTPSMNGAILNAPQVAAMRGRQGMGSMSYSPSINIAGDATEKTVALIENALARDQQQFFSRWMRANKEFGNRIA